MSNRTPNPYTLRQKRRQTTCQYNEKRTHRCSLAPIAVLATLVIDRVDDQDDRTTDERQHHDQEVEVTLEGLGRQNTANFLVYPVIPNTRFRPHSEDRNN